MMFNIVANIAKCKAPSRLWPQIAAVQKCFFSQKIETKYTDQQKEKILQVINDSDANALSGYEVTKSRLKKFSQWKQNNGPVKNIADIELIDGFTERTAVKLCDSILEGPSRETKLTNKIKGQFLQPSLIESVRQKCKTVLSVFISVNSVCWTLIDRDSYEVVKWQYHGIKYVDGKKPQITDIFNIAWEITQKLPFADIYVMKAEATTLRAAGSDPNNPKVIAVNLQKAQMVAMIVALINARSHSDRISEDPDDYFKQKVYFLRPTLPYRLYGTLVGNEKVSTEQTVEIILQNSTSISSNNSHVYVPEKLQNMFRVQKDLQKDMLGHTFLLALTFMDLCIYRNEESISRLMRQRSD